MDKRLDHRGARLPAGVYRQLDRSGNLSGYTVRWREGRGRHASRTFSATACGSLDRALAQASGHREEATAAAQIETSIARGDPIATISVNELFERWCVGHGPLVSERYAEEVIRRWEREIAPRPVGQISLAGLSQDPAIVVRFQDELLADGVSPGNRTEILKTLRAVLRWGRRRHPNAILIDFSGLFEMPRRNGGRLAYAADAYGLERIIEAVLSRPVRDDLLALRDGAFVAAMGFTVAARPSEWLYSARWGDLHPHTVELQRASAEGERQAIGLKTGARAALLLSSARERIATYRAALEERYGEQPPEGLVFQALGEEGPLWDERDGARTPAGWSRNHYTRWTARVWRPARKRAAQVADAPAGLATMRFYDCRHTAISMALHSTLVSGPYGMNLHNLAAWAGHDVQTMQRYYSHVIARYQSLKPIDLEEECRRARERVAAEPA